MIEQRLAVVQAEQGGADAGGQAALLAGGEHDPAGGVGLLQRAAAMRAHLHDQHVADVQLRDDAHEHGGDAGGVGVGELGQIAGAHEDLGLRAAPRSAA